MNRREVFWNRLPEVFSYPFRGNGLYTIIGITIALYVLSFLPIIGGLLAGGIFFSFLFNIIGQTAMGKDEVPELTEFLDFFDNILLPLIRGVLATFFIIFPLILYFWLLKDWSDLKTFSPEAFIKTFLDPFIFIFLFIGFFYYPIAIILAAINENLFHILNPVIGINLIRKAFLDYCALVFFLVLFGFLDWVFQKILTHSILKIDIPVITSFIAFTCKLYFPILSAHIMGLWILQNNDKFDYSPLTKPEIFALDDSSQDEKKNKPTLDDPIIDELNQANIFLEKNQTVKAEEIFSDLHGRFPEDPRPTQGLFEIALNQANTHAMAHYIPSLVEVLLSQKNHEKVRDIYHQTLPFGPHIELTATILFKLGQEFYRKNFVEHSMKAYMQLGILFPHDQRSIKALYAVGNMYMEQLKNPTKALTLFKHLTNTYPESPLIPNIEDAMEKCKRIIGNKSLPSQ